MGARATVVAGGAACPAGEAACSGFSSASGPTRLAGAWQPQTQSSSDNRKSSCDGDASASRSSPPAASSACSLQRLRVRTRVPEAAAAMAEAACSGVHGAQTHGAHVAGREHGSCSDSGGCSSAVDGGGRTLAMCGPGMSPTSRLAAIAQGPSFGEALRRLQPLPGCCERCAGLAAAASLLAAAGASRQALDTAGAVTATTELASAALALAQQMMREQPASAAQSGRQRPSAVDSVCASPVARSAGLSDGAGFGGAPLQVG